MRKAVSRVVDSILFSLIASRKASCCYNFSRIYFPGLQFDDAFKKMAHVLRKMSMSWRLEVPWRTTTSFPPRSCPVLNTTNADAS